MFATVSRARAAQPQREMDVGPSQEERSRGVDSCYGVKSLMSDWDEAEAEAIVVDVVSPMEQPGEAVEMVSNDSGVTPTVEHRRLEEVDAILGGDTLLPSPLSHPHKRDIEVGPSPPIEGYTPLSFASLSTHAQSHGLLSEPSSPASFTSMPTSAYLSASLSSLSRSSSPTGSSFDLGPGYRGSGRGYARLHASSASAHLSQLGQSYQSGHDTSLVLPTMSLPSSSLHFSIAPLSAEKRGFATPEAGVLTVLLIGAHAETSRLVRELADDTRVKLYDLQMEPSYTREIGIFKDNAASGFGSALDARSEEKLTMLARLRVLSPERNDSASINALIKETYQPLHNLLHPDLERGSPQLRTLVENWAGDQRRRVDDGSGTWLDLAIMTGGDALSDQDVGLLSTMSTALSTVVSTSGAIPASLPLFTIPQLGMTESLPTESPSRSWADPTPRCDSHDVEGYFSSRPETPTSSDGSPRLADATTSKVTASRLVGIFLAESKADEQIISDLHKASATSFNTWRRRPSRSHTPVVDLSSSQTTATSLESGNDAPIPTLARAQGGGEWEAGLSRRVAARRQSEKKRGKSFRAIHGGNYLELFPRGVPSLLNRTHHHQLFSSIFYPFALLSRALSGGSASAEEPDKPSNGRPGWSRLVVAACAVGVVLCGVGVSYWAVRY